MMTCTPASRRRAAAAWMNSTLLAATLLLAACGGGPRGPAAAAPPAPAAVAPTIHAPANAPAKLSAWNLARIDGSTLTLNGALVPYDLNAALYSDAAWKLRAIYVPPGKAIAYSAPDTLDFPVGTAL